MKKTLDTQVATAVGAMLVGREEITLDEVAHLLPAHIRAAGPSLKSMTRALTGAGWEAERRTGGAVAYVAPGTRVEPTIGDNADGVGGEEVRSLIERIERLLEERKGIGDDIKDTFAEAKSRGFDVGAMRGVLRIRAKDPAQRHEETAMLEVYMRALGMMA